MIYRERALYRKKVCLPGSMAYLILLFSCLLVFPQIQVMTDTNTG